MKSLNPELAGFCLMMILGPWALVTGAAQPLADTAEQRPFLHPIFASHMVLQRNTPDPVWGWAAPGASVTVRTQIEGHTPAQIKTATAAPDGRWEVVIGPFPLLAKNQTLSLTVSSDHHAPVALTDVLVGDVWLCSGQSNMARSLARHDGIPDVPNQDAEIADTINYPLIRQYYLANIASAEPQRVPTAIKTDETGVSGPWQVNNPVNARQPSRSSAVAYFFARDLFNALNVPIGIVQMSWGGTPIQGWIDPVTLSEDRNFHNAVTSMPKNPDTNNGGAIYNGKVATITPFQFKGVVWYQGESNADSPDQYRTLLPLLFKSWRKAFGQPELPFIVIQLPNFENDHWPILRDAQLNAVTHDPLARLVVTIDLGDPKQLHPADKQDVARRAALAARDVAYGQKIVSFGPLLKRAAPRGSVMLCQFTSVGAGLMIGQAKIPPLKPYLPVIELKSGALTGFEIAGADGVLYAGSARITGKDLVEVENPKVTSPVCVRYAWAGAPTANLYNKIINRDGSVDGLPASPFRFPD